MHSTSVLSGSRGCGHGADLQEAGLSLLSWPSDRSLPTPLPEGAVGLLHVVGVPNWLMFFRIDLRASRKFCV